MKVSRPHEPLGASLDASVAENEYIWLHRDTKRSVRSAAMNNTTKEQISKDSSSAPMTLFGVQGTRMLSG